LQECEAPFDASFEQDLFLPGTDAMQAIRSLLWADLVT
jgi:hypothetical protein